MGSGSANLISIHVNWPHVNQPCLEVDNCRSITHIISEFTGYWSQFFSLMNILINNYMYVIIVCEICCNLHVYDLVQTHRNHEPLAYVACLTPETVLSVSLDSQCGSHM